MQHRCVCVWGGGGVRDKPLIYCIPVPVTHNWYAIYSLLNFYCGTFPQQGYFCRALALNVHGQMLKGVDAYNAYKKSIQDSITSYQMSGKTEQNRLDVAISTAVSESKLAE